MLVYDIKACCVWVICDGERWCLAHVGACFFHFGLCHILFANAVYRWRVWCARVLVHDMMSGLKTAVFSGKDVGGTCVNRGCVPSKALLAASGRVREMQDDHHLDGMGIKVL